MATGSSTAGGSSQSAIAYRRWEMDNSMQIVNAVDEVYRFDQKQQQTFSPPNPGRRSEFADADWRVSEHEPGRTGWFGSLVKGIVIKLVIL